MSDKPPAKHLMHGNYRRADWFEARCKELEAAGDVLAHCLLFRDFKPELEGWWKLRGGKCTVCEDPHQS
jgi:hypothetical protein